MASVTAIQEQFKSQLKTLGKQGLQALFPNDLNTYYTIAFELVDSNNKVVDYFLFPVNPNEIKEIHNELTRIKKTITGVSSLKNQTFSPVTISIAGDFGKKFKLILGGQSITFAGISISGTQGLVQSVVNSVKNLVKATPEFSSFAKTGYGCIKVIERIKERSKQLDPSGKPYSLHFYNSILGGNYLVEFINFTHSQSISRNTIPAYSIQLVAIAPLDSLFNRLSNLKSIGKNLTIGNLQKTANTLANGIRGLI